MSAVLFVTACGSPSQGPSVLKDQFSGSEFYYYDQADRKDIIEQFKKAMVANYAPLEIKKQRINLDVDALFDAALAAENGITDVSSVTEQAAGNLAFIDRVHKIVAAFRDTHLWMSTVVTAPSVFNGLELAEAGNKFYIVGLREKILQFAAVNSATPSLYNQIALGDEVISIDGTSLNDLVTNLMPFESASSQAFQRQSAVKALTNRNYSAPTQATAVYEIRKANGSTFKVELPYVFNSGTTARPDAEHLYKERGFVAAKDLKMTWDETKRTWSYKSGFPVSGYDAYSQMPNGLLAGTEWSEDGELIMRTGFLLRDGKAYGVLQLYSFMGKNLTSSATGEVKPFSKAISDYVTSLASAKTPLILDLRNNGGGITAYTMPVLAAVAKTGESYPAFTKSFRVTRKIRQMLETYPPTALNEAVLDKIEYEELKSAIADRRTHTNALSQADSITSSIGGYDEQVVVLVTPNCISSCDITSMLMKASKRTTIIGSHSNGTGAGMTSYTGFADSKWRDEFDVIKVNIPNFLFGFPGAPDQVIHTGNAFYDLNSENVPVEADVNYESQLVDFLEGSSGWFNKAIEVIKAQQN
jgi:hypothetical protein